MENTNWKNIDGYEEAAWLKKYAGRAIWILWISGTLLILFFLVYFLIIPIPDMHNDISLIGMNEVPEELFPDDKTTLVNIGLRMQSVSENTEENKTPGTLGITKGKYEQKRNPIIRSQKPPAFQIKAVPK